MIRDTLFACPECRSDLHARGAELVCGRCGRAYAVEEGSVARLVPNADAAARPISGPWSVYHRVLAHPRVYDRAQRYGGGVPIAGQVQRVLADTGGKTVLDVGAGTGMVADILPSDARYVWLDNDELKLRGFRRKHPSALSVLGDAAHLPFRDDAVDVVTMVEVSHHLPDVAFRGFLQQVARVTRERFVFVDGLRTSRLRSRLLWALDLGRFPRTRAQLESFIGELFEIRQVVEFRVNHDHVIFDAVPRRA